VQVHEYRIRSATAGGLDEATAVMLDAAYRDAGTGYVPPWHADVISPERSTKTTISTRC
jgi:hypothetical protein